MIKIDLSSEEKLLTRNHSSKGNQNKWFYQGRWYKADHMGYEGISEVLISALLEKSNIKDYVKYSPVMIKYLNREIPGCVSESFLKENEEIITFERLHRSFTGRGMAKILSEITDVSEKVSYTVDFLKGVTGIQDSGIYMSLTLEMDALFLNEDRHTNNLAVIRNVSDNTFRFAPVFDNGLSLLSDINDYPPDADIDECIDRVEAKPFCRSFTEQSEAAAGLYGYNVEWYFNRSDVNRILDSLSEYYSDELLLRVQKIMYSQMRKYGIG